MKITLEPTGEIQRLDSIPHRLWKGVSDTGIPIVAFIRCVQPQTDNTPDAERFVQELQSLPAPQQSLTSVDWRLVI